MKITNFTWNFLFLSMPVLCRLVVSWCQCESPLLLWTGSDNRPLAAISNPPFDFTLWIMHCNHSFTNLLGMPIYKNSDRNSQNTDPHIGQADSTTVIYCQRLFLQLRGIFRACLQLLQTSTGIIMQTTLVLNKNQRLILEAAMTLRRETRLYDK